MNGGMMVAGWSCPWRTASAPSSEMRLLCGSEDQAQRIEENFRQGAEDYYNRIMEMLSQ